MIPEELRLAMDEWERTGKVPDLYAFADAWEAEQQKHADTTNELTGIIDALRGQLKDSEQAREQAEREREDAKRHTYCAYCGEDFPIDDPGTPMTVTRHIFACPKHPIAEIRRRLMNRVWANCTLGTAEELETQALIDYIDESATPAPNAPEEGNSGPSDSR